MASNVIAVRHLSKVYNSKPPINAVHKISFELRQSEILGLLGPNGAGKTTTIRMLLSLLTPSSGEIEILGLKYPHQRSAILQKVGYASTYTNLPMFLTVWENLNIHALIYGISKSRRYELIEQALIEFNCLDLRNRFIGQLSAGQRTKIMLIRAFLPEPEIVLLDEPTASLDPAVANDVRQYILHKRKTKHISLLITSHNMKEVSDICDRVIFIRQGEILASDTPQNLARSSLPTNLVLNVISDKVALNRILKQRNLNFKVVDDKFSIEISEADIASLIGETQQQGVGISGMEINHPSLEDYFLRNV